MTTILCPRCNLTSEPEAKVCMFCGHEFNSKIKELETARKNLIQLMHNMKDEGYINALNLSIKLIEKEIVNL